jgi:RNA polymerase sigma factor for flagellar operon FliA
VALEERDAMASAPEGTGPHGLTPEEALARAELLSLVRAIVAKLPALERALVERTYFRGATLPQAAAALGLSRSWAHRVHARAMEAIERELRRPDRMGVGANASWPRRS